MIAYTLGIDKGISSDLNFMEMLLKSKIKVGFSFRGRQGAKGLNSFPLEFSL